METFLFINHNERFCTICYKSVEDLYLFAQNLAVTQKGVENLAIAKPDGWRAWLEGDVLTITAPAKENVYAETSGEVSVVAVGATATVIAKVQVLATDEILGGAGAGSSEWEEWN